MKTQENSDSIVSDEQSLELDCRIIIPKFKRAEYDTFQTEVDTSVLNRVMQIRSNSQDFKFIQSPQILPKTQISKTEKKIQCTLLNDDQYAIQLGVKLQMQPIIHKKNDGKSERKQHLQSNNPKSVNNQQSLNQNIHQQKICQIYQSHLINNDTQKQIRQSTIRQGKRQFSQTYNPSKVEASPLRLPRFSQRQIYVTQLVTCQKETLQEKLNLVQQENNEKVSRKSLSPYQRNARTIKQNIDTSQIKGILKSRSCQSEDGRRNRSHKEYQTTKKSGFDKKVTFQSSEHIKKSKTCKSQRKIVHHIVIL